MGQRSGSSSSGLDVSNLFKPALGRGHLQVIGATTLDEHRKYIQKDAALERRFQPVHVDEPTEPEAVEILQGLKVGFAYPNSQTKWKPWPGPRDRCFTEAG